MGILIPHIILHQYVPITLINLTRHIVSITQNNFFLSQYLNTVIDGFERGIQNNIYINNFNRNISLKIYNNPITPLKDL